MKILVINGPNLNMLGFRDQNTYGNLTYPQLCQHLFDYYDKIEFYQSNHEGEIVDKIHEIYLNKSYEGLIINPGAYAHTSIAIMDALHILAIPKVEVHLSDISKREDFRQKSYTKLACDTMICGLQGDGYIKAIDFILYQDK